MKKFLFFAVVATMFASCTNENIDYLVENQTQEIVFDTPVMHMNSRAAITSETYPTGIPFKVYAQRTSSNYASGWGNNFMDGVEVKYSGDCWAPEKAYYWPKNGDKISFAAVSPADATGTVTYGTGGLKVENHVINTIVADQQDLMYAPRVYNQKKSENAVVNLKFKHALSLLSFNVKKTAVNSTIKLKSIAITGLHNEATFSEGITDGEAYSSTPSWTEPASESTADFKVYTSEGGELTQDYVNFGNLLAIPQRLCGEEQITIKWSYTNGGSVSNEVDDELTFILKSSEIKYWTIGVKYNYNITIALDKITFSPSVAEWGEAEKNITIQ